MNRNEYALKKHKKFLCLLKNRIVILLFLIVNFAVSQKMSEILISLTTKFCWKLFVLRAKFTKNLWKKSLFQSSCLVVKLSLPWHTLLHANRRSWNGKRTIFLGHLVAEPVLLRRFQVRLKSFHSEAYEMNGEAFHRSPRRHRESDNVLSINFMVLQEDSLSEGPSLCWTSFGLPLNFHLLWRARLGAWINATHADLLVSTFSSIKEMCERCISRGIIFVHWLREVENKPYYLRYDRADPRSIFLGPLKNCFPLPPPNLPFPVTTKIFCKAQIDDNDKSLHSIKTFSKFITGWRGVAEWKFRVAFH